MTLEILKCSKSTTPKSVGTTRRCMPGPILCVAEGTVSCLAQYIPLYSQCEPQNRDMEPRTNNVNMAICIDLTAVSSSSADSLHIKFSLMTLFYSTNTITTG
ncbi:hypothetical protein SERLA73DRAFT_188127 [Serpula lacrymans var. lacrymans S7.3]|uniref:Uncharacterized protein n=2 Tax=Serpula lacrymans var. lacrymans TaxID=341189 RepID=F8QAS9_SERL3|nr:uncharacterized protein SERLADRAFT_478127 [Serpula lacrymans var. lacrymans S7.9]EGN94315.1 hypothetical protein SERLA73DRAFT_188127 [Serpula lacrymans var. lacrymans S7.3]EGO19804.1 hypothetical protein SERLADRAFT_478127 [Serpula lacrymans var. lacrymans S7.9]